MGIGELLNLLCTAASPTVVWSLATLPAMLRLPPLHRCAAQVAPYELLRSLKSQAVEPAILEVGGVKVTVEMQ